MSYSGQPISIQDGGTNATTASAARTSLGIGTIATQNANSVTITGGSITGITPIALSDGGTGAISAADARTNLGLGTAATINTPISLTNGGTAASLTASNGGVVYSTASALAILGFTATANQPLLSGASGAPGWSTATYPGSTTINQILYSSAANTIVGLATTNNGVLITGTTGIPSLLSAGSTGQVLTATTGSPPSWVAGAAGTVTSVSGTSNRVTSTGGATPVIDISGSYVGQSSITTLGTITTGTWTGTTIAIANGGTNATSMATSTGIVKYDGTRLVTSTAVIDSSNRILNSSQTRFSAYVGSTVTNVTGDATSYTVIYNTENFDVGSNFDTTTGLFTAPVTGMYHFSGVMYIQSIGAAHLTLNLLSTTGHYLQIDNPFANAVGGVYMLNWSKDELLTATTTFGINLVISGSTKTIGLLGGNYINEFNGYLLPS